MATIYDTVTNTAAHIPLSILNLFPIFPEGFCTRYESITPITKGSNNPSINLKIKKIMAPTTTKKPIFTRKSLFFAVSVKSPRIFFKNTYNTSITFP